jgi:transaldolase
VGRRRAPAGLRPHRRRRRLFIKIPATLEGLPAISAALAEGISVNVTLIFSLERYGQVIDAFFEGLEKARANGHDLSRIASVASFFVSRVDTEIDKRLEKLGGTELRGKAGIANARLAYALFEEKFATDRWQALKDAGARPQRPLWASTGVKNPDYRDTMYVEELVAPQTVNTMPEPTLDAVADHGEVRGNTIQGYYDDARAHMAALKDAGVDYDDVVRVLEDEGVEKFEVSWNELLDTIKRELEDKA